MAVPAGAAELVFEGGGQRMEAEVVDAAPMMRHATVMLKFRLDATATEAFSAFTAGLIGQNLTISLCDQELVNTVVQERIASGQGLITVIDDDIAATMAEVLRGEKDCTALEPPLGN